MQGNTRSTDEMAELIENTFAEWAEPVSTGDWNSERMGGSWVIFTNAEMKLQAEIGIRESDNELFVKVYDIPALEGETHLDVSLSLDSRKTLCHQSVEQVIRDEGMTIMGAITGAR